MDLQPGLLVTQSLQLVRQLGSGGMGTIWIARHTGLRTEVVVKFITGDHAKDPEAIARFEREAAAAAEVKSPHVVQMIDHGVSLLGPPFIAMELLEGEDLGERLRRCGGKLPIGEVAGIFTQAARALARAHDKRIVHRDIKPENIFLCDTGEDEPFVKVLDFGIAKVVDPSGLASTKTGFLMGSPYYMSPEQFTDVKRVDHRSDVWSLGVVGYFAMTGVRPFDGDTIGGLAVHVCSGVPKPPTSVAPELPTAVDAWFARSCAQKPDERFQSVRAQADALVEILGGPQAIRVANRPTVPAPNPGEAPAPRPRPHAASAPALVSSVPEQSVVLGPPIRSRAPLIGVAVVVLALGGLGAATVLRAPGSDKPTPSAAAAPGSSSVATPTVSTSPPPPATPSSSALPSTSASVPTPRPAAPGSTKATTPTSAKPSASKPTTTSKPVGDEPIE